MKRHIRLIAAGAASLLFLISCGGSDSSGRTKNSALCYATQEEKDAAIKAAQDAFDAVSGAVDDVVPEEVPEGTPTTVEEETPTTIPEVTPTAVVTEEAGGGYRRPAVRHASGGDTSTTVEELTDSGEGDGESQDGSLTPEQQQAQMNLEAAEAQPLCETETSDSSVIECTGRVTVEGATNDCGPVELYVADDGTWHLDDEAQDPVLTLVSGTVDLSALSADNPVEFPISFANQNVESEEVVGRHACMVRVNQWGFNWNCTDPVSVAVSSSGVDSSMDCATSGVLTVDGDFDFSFAMWIPSVDPFFSGVGSDQEQDTEFEIALPDAENLCPIEESDPDNWDSLPFSGQSDEQSRYYEFTVPDDMEGLVYVKFESTNEFDVDFDGEPDFELAPECPEPGCENWTGYSMWDLGPGTYRFEIEDNAAVVTWSSNVEIQGVVSTLPDVPFTYETDGSEQRYTFTLNETQNLVFWATAGETCTVSEDDDEENGFADPEIDITGSMDVDDDNSGRGVDNCSASLIQETFEPGTYVLSVEDDDSEGPGITLGSSIELIEFVMTWELRSEFVSPDATIDIEVPEGGMWFRATTTNNQTASFSWREDSGETVSATGCFNPDGDLATDDNNCMDPVLILLDMSGDMIVDDYSSAEVYSFTFLDGVYTETFINLGDANFEVFLREGTYVLNVTQSCCPGEGEEPSTDTYELKFGFGSINAAKAKKIEAIINENPTINQSVEQVQLSDFQLSTDGSVGTSLADSVNSILCDASCIEAMFAKSEISNGTILVSAGSDPVLIRKGQRKAVIPVDKSAGEISAVVTSADGSKIVELSSGIIKLPSEVQSLIDSKTVIGNQGSKGSSKLPYLIGLIAILIAAGVVIRRKQATQNV